MSDLRTCCNAIRPVMRGNMGENLLSFLAVRTSEILVSSDVDKLLNVSECFVVIVLFCFDAGFLKRTGFSRSLFGFRLLVSKKSYTL